MNKFQKDLRTGSLGEEVIYNFLMKDSQTSKVIDVREDKIFQKLDVDFIQELTNGISRMIEVKTDTQAHYTRNLAYEHTSNKYYNTIGCFEKTKADYIFYYLTETKEVYILDTLRLRQYVRIHKDRFRQVSMGDNALGYLIKLEELTTNKVGWRMNI